MSFYENVAVTLTPEIRDAIEKSMPCTYSGGHLWDWRKAEVGRWVNYWSVCVHCRQVSR